VLAEYAANIYETAAALPGADQYSDDLLGAMVAIITNAFNFAAIVRAVLPQPEMEAQQIQMFRSLMSAAPVTHQD
jgi:hypothetical protein